MNIKKAARTPKNIENEEWSQYVIENKGDINRQNVVCQYLYENKQLIFMAISY